MSKKIIIANWKMNPASLKEAETLFSNVVKKSSFKKTEVVICPPFLYLEKPAIPQHYVLAIAIVLLWFFVFIFF